MFHFCAIATPDYLPFVETLYLSLQQQGHPCTLHALITDGAVESNTEGICYYSAEAVCSDDKTRAVFQKYGAENNNLRWALKPFFLSALLQKFEKVIYLDNDLFFFNDYSFLFDQLDHHSLLLTPHWSPFEPLPHTDNFLTSFQLGLFNAGFVGASRQGLETLAWWGDLCLFKTTDDPATGFFVDQRYLDLALIYDPRVGIVRHLGCNISSVNMHQNQRYKVGNEVLLQNKFPVIFIHFSAETVEQILNSNDRLLRPYYDEYAAAFSKTGHLLTAFKHKQETPSGVVQLKRRLRLRTRLKAAIFRLYQWL